MFCKKALLKNFSNLLHYDTLLQNATEIITKWTAILLQNVIKVYYKMRQVFYYKMEQFIHKLRQSLQNATVITKCVSTAVKTVNYDTEV